MTENTSFPSKFEVIGALLKEDPQMRNMDKFIAIIEHKLLTKNMGIVKLELLQNGKVILKGKLTTEPKISSEEGAFDWNMLRIGESHFVGYSLDLRGQSFKSLIKGGFEKSLKDGRIPFWK